jgi:hypothetical protein
MHPKTGSATTALPREESDLTQYALAVIQLLQKCLREPKLLAALSIFREFSKRGSVRIEPHFDVLRIIKTSKLPPSVFPPKLEARNGDPLISRLD